MAGASKKQTDLMDKLQIKYDDDITVAEASSLIDERMKATGAKKEETKVDKPDDMSKGDWAEKDRITRDSIEQQKASDLAPGLARAKKELPGDMLINAAYNWAMSILQNWSSQGEAPTKAKEPEPTEKMITDEQIERIREAAKKYEGHMLAYTKLMKDAYDTSYYKKLNTLQAEDLIKRLAKGEGL